MTDTNRKPGKLIELAVMLLISTLIFVGIYSILPTGSAASNEQDSADSQFGLTIEFGCNVWVEEIFAATREDILISVASYFDNMAPLSGVEGEVTVVFPDGEKALFYLPISDEQGMSSVSVTSARELADIETGRVLISVNLHTFDMQCDTETSFYVWQ